MQNGLGSVRFSSIWGIFFSLQLQTYRHVSKLCMAQTSSKNDHILLLHPVQVIATRCKCTTNQAFLAPQAMLVSLVALDKGTLLSKKREWEHQHKLSMQGSSHHQCRSSVTAGTSSPRLVVPAPFLMHYGRSSFSHLVLNLFQEEMIISSHSWTAFLFRRADTQPHSSASPPQLFGFLLSSYIQTSCCFFITLHFSNYSRGT